MGTLFKKKGSKQWQMGVMVGGRQICRSTKTTNKGIAKSLLARWETEIFERRFHLPQSTPPYFEDRADNTETGRGGPVRPFHDSHYSTLTDLCPNHFIRLPTLVPQPATIWLPLVSKI
jgi:hypothetical protein